MIRARLITSLALALALAVSCTATETAGPAREPGRPLDERSGGTVAFGVLGSPATIDPYGRGASDLTRALARPVWPSLYRFSPDGSAEPYLAASIEESEGSARVELRDVTWSNGKPISARDVALSARRAGPPSGFAGLRVRAAGPRAVTIEGAEDDWERRLARFTFILPEGRVRFAPSPSGGPFRLESVTGGLGLELVRNENYWAGAPALLDRVRVRYVESLDLLLTLLGDGRLDAAWLPYSVNLEARLDELGLKHSQTLGWELVRLDFAGLSEPERRLLAARIDRVRLERFFVRGGGRVADTLHPDPGRGGAKGLFGQPGGPLFVPQETIGIGAPIGDELLGLVQRAIFEQLERTGIDAETIDAPPLAIYGRFDGAELILRRSLGAPGLHDPRGAEVRSRSLPLFQVRSLVAYRRVAGIDIDATIEGPLSGAQNWFLVEK